MPAEIIVGIIGVETIYGQHMGGFRVIDALATLAFDFPDAHPRAAERRAFFQRELEQFLSLMDRTGMTRTARAAATPAPWAWASSCHRAGHAGPWTLTATAASTCGAARRTP